MESDIMRPLSDVEKGDMRQLGTKTPQQVFLAKLADVRQKFVKAHRPFDSQCANLDFSDYLEKVEKESERLHGFIRSDDLKKLEFGDLEKYGDEKRFVVERDDEDVEMQIVTVGGRNVQKNVIVGHTVRYRCKERGHGCSVYMTMDEYEERFKKKKEEK